MIRSLRLTLLLLNVIEQSSQHRDHVCVVDVPILVSHHQIPYFFGFQLRASIIFLASALTRKPASQ